MQSAMRCFRSLSRPRTQEYLIKSNLLFWNSFCSMSQSVQLDNSVQRTESPELPDWVKPGDSKDDDFVLPSLSFWIENHKHHAQSADLESPSGDTGDTDLDKICAKLKSTHFETVDSVISALNELSIDITEDILEQIMERFCFDWILLIGSFRWMETHMGCKCSPNMYNLLISNLGKGRKFDLMWQFVEEMKQLEGYVTSDTLNIVIRRLAKAGKHHDAIEVFRDLEKYGFTKNVEILNCLIDALCKTRGVELAESVYLEFKDVLPPSNQTFNILVNGWCRIRKMSKAEKTLEEMTQHGFEPDVVTYTSFIEAYCREKDFHKVDATMKDMRRKRLNPSIVTYTIIIKALGRAKEIQKSLDVYAEAKKDGCIPDSSLYTVLITNLSKSGRLKDARELFEDMTKEGVAPDRIAYNGMIAAAVQHSREEDALLLLKRMEESGCKPDLGTYSPLLKMCCRLKRMKVLKFLLEHMFKNNVSLDLSSYTLLINRLRMNGSPERACAFFEESVKRGFVPLDCLYKKLVEELQKKGLDEEKARIEKLMQHAKAQGSVSLQNEA